MAQNWEPEATTNDPSLPTQRGHEVVAGKVLAMIHVFSGFCCELFPIEAKCSFMKRDVREPSNECNDEVVWDEWSNRPRVSKHPN
jgi:hypothetical protein